MRRLRGVIPVLTTPINKDGSIDIEGLQRLVEFLVSKKIGGLWVLGTGSEDMNLTFKKRLEVAKVVSETNAGRVPIVLGAGFFALEEILEFISGTYMLDVDAYHVMPYHPLLSLDRLDWFYRHIADNCPKPLWMYSSGNWCQGCQAERRQFSGDYCSSSTILLVSLPWCKGAHLKPGQPSARSNDCNI
jgi:4-hydroxy-tetrahydrodipicolinate synthase